MVDIKLDFDVDDKDMEDFFPTYEGFIKSQCLKRAVDLENLDPLDQPRVSFY
jgi:hypothetical protein